MRTNHSGVFIPAPWLVPTISVAILFLLTLVSFRQTLAAMITTWYSSRTFSHCFLVFPLSAYLIWRRRRQLAELTPKPHPWALIPLILLSAVWIVADLGETRLIQEWAFVAIVVTTLWTLLGAAIVRTLELPLAFLAFAVPFGLSLIGPLQDLTAWFAVHALTLSRIPAVVENRVLSVPGATWTVAEACSGIRYLFSSVMLGVIYAWITYRSRRRRLIFVAASVFVPILANGVRAYGIVLLAYLTNNRLAADVDHLVYGWLFFTIVQLALFMVGLRWRQTPNDEAPQSHAHGDGDRNQIRPLLVTALVTALLVVLTPFAAHLLWSRASQSSRGSDWPDPPVSVSLPWHAIPAYDTSWIPELRDNNRNFVQSYASGDHRIDLYWSLHTGERSFELLNAYNQIANPRLWSPVADGREYETVNGQRIGLRQTSIRSGSTSRSVLTWYWIDGQFTSNPSQVKYLQAKARLLGRSPTTCLFAVSTDSDANPGNAQSVFRDFLAHASLLTRVSASTSVQANANRPD